MQPLGTAETTWALDASLQCLIGIPAQCDEFHGVGMRSR